MQYIHFSVLLLRFLLAVPHLVLPVVLLLLLLLLMMISSEFSLLALSMSVMRKGMS